MAETDKAEIWGKEALSFSFLVFVTLFEGGIGEGTYGSGCLEV
jgi:hypothetical protein